MNAPWIQLAVEGQTVEFTTKDGALKTAKVIKRYGEVYLLKLGPQETTKVHHKYLTKILTSLEPKCTPATR